MYEGRFNPNIFYTEREKKKASSVWYPFQIYKLYFSINTILYQMKYERVEKQDLETNNKTIFCRVFF